MSLGFAFAPTPQPLFSPLGAFAVAVVGIFLPIHQEAKAAITVAPVNDIMVIVADTLGSDAFALSVENRGTAYFFGNLTTAPAAQPNLDTADRIPLDAADSVQYFQSDTVIPRVLGSPLGSSMAYWFESLSNKGATAGTNFSIYDVNQDRVPDTVFRLDFGPLLSDRSDDLILSYAYDLSGIDVNAARLALLVPEPTTATLLILSVMARAHSRSIRR